MIYDYFRVTGAHDTVLDYADLFSVALHDDSTQEFDSRWDEVLLSMSKIPSDDVQESRHKLRTRESDQLKTVLDLHDMQIHHKISTPNYRKLKTMVKRSLGSETQIAIFLRQTRENRNTNCEQNTLTLDIFSFTSHMCLHHIWAQGVAARVS